MRFCILIIYLTFSFLLNTSIQGYESLFPDFDLSLRRYGHSDHIYDYFFQRIDLDNTATTIRHRELKKRLATLYNQTKLVSPYFNNRQRIPKKIHQIWLGSEVPERFQKWRETWQGWKGWEYKLWTDADIEEYKLHNKSLYDQAKNYGERSDIARYEILLREGGIYVDIDFECLNPDFFIFANNKYDFYSGMEPLETNAVSVCNALIAAAPNHPLIEAIVMEMKEHYKIVYDPLLGHFSTIATTGPRYFTKQILRHQLCDNYIDIIFPTTFFYPMTWEDCKLSPEEYIHFLRPESAAIHWWGGSWHKPGGEVKPKNDD